MPADVTREMSQDTLAHKITQLNDRDRAAVEALVDSMLATAHAAHASADNPHTDTERAQ
jgi:hypothetical protein